MLEIVLPEDQAAMAQAMLPLAIDQSGKTLSSKLAPDDLKAYQAAMAKLDLPAAQFDLFEPWFAAMTLSVAPRSEEHTSELQSLMRTSYAVFCLKKKTPH